MVQPMAPWHLEGWTVQHGANKIAQLLNTTPRTIWFILMMFRSTVFMFVLSTIPVVECSSPCHNPIKILHQYPPLNVIKSPNHPVFNGPQQVFPWDIHWIMWLFPHIKHDIHIKNHMIFPLPSTPHWISGPGPPGLLSCRPATGFALTE